MRTCFTETKKLHFSKGPELVAYHTASSLKLWVTWKLPISEPTLTCHVLWDRTDQVSVGSDGSVPMSIVPTVQTRVFRLPSTSPVRCVNVYF